MNNFELSKIIIFIIYILIGIIILFFLFKKWNKKTQKKDFSKNIELENEENHLDKMEIEDPLNKKNYSNKINNYPLPDNFDKEIDKILNENKKTK